MRVRCTYIAILHTTSLNKLKNKYVLDNVLEVENINRSNNNYYNDISNGYNHIYDNKNNNKHRISIDIKT